MRTAEDGLLVLPDAADPRVTLAEDRHSRWTLELDEGARFAVDHERIHAAGIWTLRIPPSDGERVPTTAAISDRLKLVGVTLLRFEVSRDEEYIALSLVRGGEVTALGDRTHHEVLLALARARRADQQRRRSASPTGAPPTSRPRSAR